MLVYKYYWCVLFLSIVLGWHGASGADDEVLISLEYDVALSQLNAKLAELVADDNTSCPINSVTLSCGNGNCDAGTENEENCPADCIESHLKSYNHYISCESVDRFFEPQSIEEVQQIIKEAAQQNIRVRLVGSRHTVNRQFCTDGVVISTQKLDSILGLTKHADGTNTVEVQAGLTMGKLSKWLHKRNLSLGYTSLGFRDATIAGAIATGVHGSSPKHNAILSSSVTSITLVNGLGDLLTLTSEDGDLFRAARAHLGLLGAVVKISLKVVPQFRLRVRVSTHDDQELFDEDGVFSQVEDCDYSFINWFPEQQKFLKTCGVETWLWAERGAENTLLRPNVLPGLMLPLRLAMHFGMCYDFINNGLESLRYLLLKWQPPFQKRDFFGRTHSSHKVVGYSHQMMSSKFIEPQEHFFQHDFELAIPLSKIDGALQAIAQHVSAHHMHFPLVGIFLRFAHAQDTTLLAHSAAAGEFIKDEPVVFVEFPTPAAIGFPLDVVATINAPFDELAKLLIENFSARPHWGKNKKQAFKLANHRKAYGDNIEKFKTAMNILDPHGIFITDFTKDINLAAE